MLNKATSLSKLDSFLKNGTARASYNNFRVLHAPQYPLTSLNIILNPHA